MPDSAPLKPVEAISESSTACSSVTLTRLPFFDRRLLVRLRIVKHHFVALFDFVLSR